MARELGARGAAVAVVDIDEEAAGKVADDVRQGGAEALALRCDVLRRGQIERVAEEVQQGLGAPTVLINGAGGNRADATTAPDRPFWDLPKEAVQSVFELNFLGTFLASQVFGRAMAERGSGSIVNISSMNAYRPLTKIPAYSAAKGAVSNFTRWLAVYMNRDLDTEIRVNAIAPGFFLTEQNRFLLIDADSGEFTPRGATIIEHTPAGRFGDPGDLIGTLLWLLSDSSQFVNGIVVPVDGGFSAFSGV
jgi:NAD(P)-dependent dehydrogenase (short-subunit alcohol dehydrogenase family)